MALLAPVALAHHEIFESHDLMGFFGFAWPTPGEPITIWGEVYDETTLNENVPPVDVELSIDGVVVHAFRTPEFFWFQEWSYEWVPTEGIHTVAVAVDVANEFAESHEENNVLSWVVQSSYETPDMAIEGLTVRTIDTGSHALIDYEICNRGAAATNLVQPDGTVPNDFSYVEVRSSGSDTWSWIEGTWTPVLQPGECSAQSLSWDRDLIVGTLEFRAQAPCGWCKDPDLSNNVATAEGKFLLADAGVPGQQVQFPLV